MSSGFYVAGLFDGPDAAKQKGPAERISAEARPRPPAYDREAEAAFILHRRQRRFAIGEVENLSDIPINAIDIHTSAGDGARTHRAPLTDYIAPGAKAPVRFLTAAADAADAVEFDVKARASYPDPGPPGLSVGEINLQAEGKYWTVSGRVSNGGKAPARYLTVTIALWDAEDRLLNVASAYLQEAPLEPGEARDFSTRFIELPQPAARTSARVRGMWRE